MSKMDKDHYVELSVIAEFKLIKQLTSDLDLILASIKDSDKVSTVYAQITRRGALKVHVAADCYR